MKIPIEVSARHVHLCSADAAILFGKNYLFRSVRKLSQPQQFAAAETIEVVSSASKIKDVRIVGPIRNQTQLEISKTDAYQLDIAASIKISGDLDQSIGGVTLIGPKGEVKLQKGVIIAQRHLHIEENLAKEFNLVHGDLVSIKTQSKRALTFHNVYVRSRKNLDKLSFQIDTDEANSADISAGSFGQLIQ